MKTPLKIAIVLAVVAAAAAAFVFKDKTLPSVAPSPQIDATDSVGSVPAPPLPKLIDLGAGKCVPCKMMAPIIEELKKEYAARLTVEFIDVWQKPDAAKPYGVEIIPTQIFYDAGGKELFRHAGFYSKDDILAKWKELGIALTAPGLPAAGSNQISAFYFHGAVRCETCLKIESLARETIQQRFAAPLADKRLAFTSINYDEPENRHYVTDYQLPCPSLVIVRQNDTNGAPWKLLADTWQLVEDTNKFQLYVETEVAKFLAND